MEKKIYLLLPFITKEETYSSPIGDIIDGEHVPLGIYYIASFLREHGYEVAVTDALALRLTEENIADEIKSYSPTFIGISATTVLFPKAVFIAQMIKKKFPHIVTILGGRHVTSNMEHAMSFPDFDFGVIGEGEITALELLDALSQQKSISEIRGIVYRDEKGALIYTGSRPLIDNLDMLPFPAFDLIPDINVYKPPLFMHKATPLLSMMTSRGCPSKCTFCAVSLGKEYRKRSAKNIFDEIKYLIQRYHIREIGFLDDNFLLDKPRIYDLFSMIRDEGLFFHWNCMARISSVNYEFLKFLRDNGCWSIAFGIESGDEKILKTIKKGLSLEKATKVVNWCHELGIITRGFFIIGHPLETVETIDRTIQYALSIPLDLIMTSVNTPYPGTQQYDEAEKYGTLDKTDLAQFSQYNPVFVPYGLTKEILLEKQKEMHIKFYFRPKIIFRLMKFYLGQGGAVRIERLKALIMVIFLRIRTALIITTSRKKILGM
ncbi:MAG: radical SAM protein [Gammaproteobacteria bacterium]|nr:radical SAM protein [Gammaproteobacteria bacterium]